VIKFNRQRDHEFGTIAPV